MSGHALSPGRLSTGCLVALLLAAPAAAEAPGIVPRDARKHLLLDRRIVEDVQRARLVHGTLTKHPGNPLFRADEPWENALNNFYPNVHYDERDRQFLLWYKCVLHDKEAISRMEGATPIHGQGWYELFATSADAIRWEKPRLNLHSFKPGLATNAVTLDTPNVGVFHDARDPDPARRYKMIYDVGLGKMRARFSPDGRHWGEPVEPRGLTPRTGDTHNNAFRDERLGKYVLLTRLVLGERLVARSESSDFIHWSEPRVAIRSSAAEGKRRQTYCCTAFPYANGYLGYLMMYNVGTDQTVDCELVYSPDSVTWERVLPGTPFLPRGPKGSVDSACIYAPAGPPIAHDGSLMIVYGGSDFPHRGWKRHCLPCLARLRLDRFAGFEPTDVEQSATVRTVPLLATGEPLRISADAAGGSVRVAVLGHGAYSAQTCVPITADVTDAPVQWTTADFRQLRGRLVQLQFTLTGRARLYAVRGLEYVAPPVFSTAVRHFEKDLTVQVLPPGPANGGVIRYTTDGGTPNPTSPVFLTPLTLTETTVINARQDLPGIGHGPTVHARFVKQPPLVRPEKPVVWRATFDPKAEPWRATDRLTVVPTDRTRGQHLRVSREGGNPILVLDTRKGGPGTDWVKHFGGQGARVTFAHRSSSSARSSRIELFGGECAQWSFEGLPGPTADWRPVSALLRWDWNDAEAEAAGWRRAPHAFSWRETVRTVGSLVVMPAVSAGPATFDLADLRIETAVESR